MCANIYFDAQEDHNMRIAFDENYLDCDCLFLGLINLFLQSIPELCWYIPLPKFANFQLLLSNNK